MSDFALRKPAGVSRGAAISTHRGQADGPVKVLSQTAAVAGISGALLLALKAMVLVAPVVLPHGTGLDSLGRVAPNTTVAAPVANPVEIGQAVNSALDDASPVVTGLSEHTAEHQAPASGTTVPRQHNGGGTAGGSHGSTNPSSGNSGDAAAPGVVGNLVGTVGSTVDGVVPGLGDTVVKATKPVTDLVDGTVGSTVGSTLKPVTDLAKSLPIVGEVVSQVAPDAKASTSTSAPPTSGLLDGLGLGNVVSGLGLGG
ncbi:MAG TPA: hypothetical protein VGJ14_19940 [Sporichthyaceae bacterium]|jgi:hypothetical protein